MKENTSLAIALKNWRNAKSLSLNDAAKISGMPQSTISNYETRKYTPQPENIKLLSRAPTAKFVTDEASVKDKLPKYANDATDAKKIKTSYTIPYVKGKKAQVPDGKTLTLVDAKDRTKGYVAPKIVDATKDTKITYVSDAVKMTINYIDKDNKDKVIATNSIDGDKSTYTTATEIKAHKDKGYDLVKDGYPKGHIYNGNETFNVELNHHINVHTPDAPNGMSKDKLDTNISQTINYFAVENGKKTPLEGAKSSVQSVKYTNKIWTDAVTGATTKEDGWKTAKDHYDEVKSPKIHGWRTSKDKVDAKTVRQTDKDSTIEIDYDRDNETYT